MNRIVPFAFVATAMVALGPVKASPAAGTRVEIYVTARDTEQRLARSADAELTASPPVREKQEYVFVDPTKMFQTVLGIGGALTDAAAETFNKLPPDRQREVLRAYFDPDASATPWAARPSTVAISRAKVIPTLRMATSGWTASTLRMI
jgi:glucosylceramidase